MDLDVINRLYLELSQFATATTRREIDLRESSIRRGWLLADIFNDKEVRLPAHLVNRISKELNGGYPKWVQKVIDPGYGVIGVFTALTVDR